MIQVCSNLQWLPKNFETVTTLTKYADSVFLWVRENLAEGGNIAKQQCGWVGDKFEVSWQVVPKGLKELISHPDSAKVTACIQGFDGNEEDLHRSVEDGI
jgi:predicted 3-demethylubiquinone-9 3-methyltransferase (glyoxalase superfamily)